jgi:hypothetical protein
MLLIILRGKEKIGQCIHLRLELHILGNGWEDIGMDKEYKYGQMGPDMRVSNIIDYIFY